MKKFLVIALVAVFAVASVFAMDIDLSGRVRHQAVYDVDAATITNDNGANSNTYVKANFTATKAVKAGEGDIYAEVKAQLTFNTAKVSGKTSDTSAFAFTAETFKVSSFKIIGQDWNVSLLGATNNADFASSWEKNDDGHALYNAEMKRKMGVASNGVVVTVKDWSVGIGEDINFKEFEKQSSVYAAVVTPEFEAGDVKVKAGVAAAKAKTNYAVQPSVKVAYATDDLAITAAADVSYSKDGSADAVVLYDAAATASYQDYAIAAYYNNKNNYSYTAVESDGDTTLYTNGVYVKNLGYTDGATKEYKTTKGVENYLSAKADAKIEDFTVSVYGLDLINTQFIDASVATKIEEVSVSAYAGYWVSKKQAHVAAKASYKIEDVGTVAGSAYFVTADNSNSLTASISLTNTTLVNGAKLYAAYDTGNLLNKDKAVIGKVTAYAQMDF